MANRYCNRIMCVNGDYCTVPLFRTHTLFLYYTMYTHDGRVQRHHVSMGGREPPKKIPINRLVRRHRRGFLECACRLKFYSSVRSKKTTRINTSMTTCIGIGHTRTHLRKTPWSSHRREDAILRMKSSIIYKQYITGLPHQILGPCTKCVSRSFTRLQIIQLTIISSVLIIVETKEYIFNTYLYTS